MRTYKITDKTNNRTIAEMNDKYNAIDLFERMSRDGSFGDHIVELRAIGESGSMQMQEYPDRLCFSL